MTQAQRWVFTLNNYTQDDIEELIPDEEIRYVQYGKEVGKQGTPHLQGYVELFKPRTMAFLKRHWGSHIHWEKAKGTREQCELYNTKEDKEPFKLGTPLKQGKRTDLNGIYQVYEDGGNLDDIISLRPNYQGFRLGQSLLSVQKPSKEYHKKEVYWFWGPKGTGKTKAAYTLVGDSWWRTTKSSKWFTGYSGEEDVIIDELRAKNWPYSDLLELLDGYESIQEVKGGHIIWKPKRVVITTPYPPEITYQGQMEINDGGIDQLLRRITEVREFKEEIKETNTVELPLQLCLEGTQFGKQLYTIS